VASRRVSPVSVSRAIRALARARAPCRRRATPRR
jgi:hypothetical protein